jgi:hypothetical protein
MADEITREPRREQFITSAFDGLTAKGISRDDHPFTLCVGFNRLPTDDEMRAVHNFLRRTPSTCPFCKTPTYALPCTQCGEPDVSDDPRF